MKAIASVDFNEIQRCQDCSEQYGFCGYHQKKYGIDFKGDDAPKEMKHD